MESCTIILPHVNTPYLIDGVISQIKKHTLNVDYEIALVDQSDEDIFNLIKLKYENDSTVKLIRLPRIDAGFPIDFVSRTTNKDYICTLDIDAFPMHNNWLYAPIELIKKFGISFVGSDTGLSQFDEYKKQGEFTQINNYFRVSKTSITKYLSETAGFCRYQNRSKTGLSFKDVGWKLNHSDNGVVAQWFSDKERLGDKLSLVINKIIGMTPEFGVYGMCIDDLVFHMVFGYHPDTIPDPKKSLGEGFLKLEEKIKKEGLTDKNIKYLIKNLKPCHPYTSRSITILGESYLLDPKHELFEYFEKVKAYENK